MISLCQVREVFVCSNRMPEAGGIFCAEVAGLVELEGANGAHVVRM
jgi:hypothetical protein